MFRKNLFLSMSPGDDFINLGFIMINLNGTSELPLKFRNKVTRTFYTMLEFWTSKPLNLVIVTDKSSVKSVANFVAGT